MPDPFPILKVASAMRSDVEQLGSKPKFWFKHEGANWLFKEARANTGEDWAEKVAFPTIESARWVEPLRSPFWRPVVN